MSEHNPEKYISLGRAVIETEAQAVSKLAGRIDQQFAEACGLLLHCEGRVVVIGMGKSGHIGNKIAATLASTGTPAFFVHPGEASHGDLGMITSRDVVMLLSNSGETDEIIALLPVIKRLNTRLISLTGNPQSTLAIAADVNLDISVEQEACPLGLAPTSSTTATLAMGDAIAIALLEARDFDEKDFALSHPGGALGRRLLLHVSDIMHAGDNIPRVREADSFRDALVEMTDKKLGVTAVVGDQGQILGIFTDGDVRRALDSEIDIQTCSVGDVMTRDGKTIEPGALAASALALMETHRINALLVIDKNSELVGVINMHDLLQARVV